MRSFHTHSQDVRSEFSPDPHSDTELEVLKQELDYLRTELEKQNRQHSKTVSDLRQYQEHQLSRILNEKESLLSSDFNTILSFQKSLSAECDESSKLRQKILSTKLEHSENFSQITFDIERLVKEAEFLRHESIQACKAEVNSYQNLIESKRLEYTRKMRDIEGSKSSELFEIENVIDADERKIRELEACLKEMRDKVVKRSQFDEGEIGKVHATLRSTQRILEQQEKDLEVLRGERQKVTVAARDMEKGLGVVRYRVDLLKAENDELKTQLKRLEKLTYGK